MHSLPLKDGGEHHEYSQNSGTQSSAQHEVPCEVNNIDSSNPSAPQVREPPALLIGRKANSTRLGPRIEKE